MRKWANISPYMRRPLVIYDFQLLHSEFPYIWGKLDFLFYQCGAWAAIRIWTWTQVCCRYSYVVSWWRKVSKYQPAWTFFLLRRFLKCFLRSIRIPSGHLIYTLFKWLSVHCTKIPDGYLKNGLLCVFLHKIYLCMQCLVDVDFTLRIYQYYMYILFCVFVFTWYSVLFKLPI